MAMVDSGAVPNFAPSVHGFKFTNAFPPDPTIEIDLGPVGKVGLGDASQGVCGGMAFAVKDYFGAGRPIPADTEPPASSNPLYHYITGRLIDSFDAPAGIAEYVDWMLAPSAELNLLVIKRPGTFARTVATSWPRVHAEIDSGQLSTLGLVTVHTADLSQIGKCHQVTAYAYDVDDAGVVTLHVYDPNTAQDTADEVWISFNAADPHTTSAISHNINIAEPTLHGFFCSAYSAKIPPG